jgi:hypothetical protein
MASKPSTSSKIPVRWSSAFLPALLVALCETSALGSGAPAAQAGTDPTSRVHRHFPASSFQLFPPDLAAPLLSEVRATVRVRVRNTSNLPLTFALLEGPPGAAFDPASGALTWTPAAAAEGTVTEIRVRATDGRSSDEVEFSLAVASPTAIATTLTGSTLRVTQSGTLQGVSLTLPPGLSRPAAELGVATLAPGETPPLPDRVRRLSDFFRVTPVAVTGEDSSITLSLPAALVPAGAKPQDLRLYVYTDRATTTDRLFWACAWNNLDVMPDHSVTMNVSELGELCFIGTEPPGDEGLPPAPGALVARTLEVGPLAVSVGCSGKLLSSGVQDLRQQVCQVTGDVAMTVTVKHFWRRQWQPAATIEEMVGWLVAAKQVFAGWGVKSSPVFEVVVEPMPQPTWIGFAWGAENFRVLHLDQSARPRELMQIVTAHEFFHHSQSRTRLPGLSNAVSLGWGELQWIIEGTASWAQDEVFPEIDGDKVFFGGNEPLTAILNSGPDPVPAAADAETNAYLRAFFWKAVAGRCSGFSPPAVLNADLTGDVSGLRNLINLMAAPSWACDFGAGFGEASRTSLASALLYYQHATQKMNDIRLLNPKESPFAFAPTGWGITPAECQPPPTGCPATAMTSAWLAAKSAWALEVAPVASLDPNKEIALEVVTGTPPVWVWVGDDEYHQELDAGSWFNSSGVNSYVYAQLGHAPKLFLGVVNPSLDQAAHVAAKAVIRPKKAVITPFSVTSVYPDRLTAMNQCATWTATASGTVTAPAGVTVNAYPHAAVPSTLRVDVVGHGIVAPYDIILEGTFSARPDPATGSCSYADGSSISWVYSNELYKWYEDGELHTGSPFRFVTGSYGTSPFWTSCHTEAYWDLHLSWWHTDGSFDREIFRNGYNQAGVLFEVKINQP